MDAASRFALLMALLAGAVVVTVALAHLLRAFRSRWMLGPARPLLRLAVSSVVIVAASWTLPAPATMPPPVLRLDAGRAGMPAASGPAMVAPVPGTEHVVVRGESLWKIARRALRAKTGVEPSSAEVARFWPSIYELNRAVIGSDPDLIRPGQLLVIPGQP